MSSSFVFLLVCVQACLIQSLPTGSSIGCGGLAASSLGLASPLAGYGGSLAAPGYGLAGPNLSLANSYGAAGFGLGSPYGGSGIGNVAVAGELPVAGTTILSGQVPIIGAVEFGGQISAAGLVNIVGSCGCGCSPNLI